MIRAVTRHTITGPFQGEILLEFDATTGLLSQLAVAAKLDATGHDRFLKRLPHHVSGLKDFTAPIVVTTVKQELTFDDFWEAYNYKVDKEVARRRWNALTTKDRIAAYNFIPAYDDFLKKKSLGKLYPSTYINKKRWNDGK